MSVWFTETFRGQILWDVAKSYNLQLDEWLSFARGCELEFDGGEVPETKWTDAVKFPKGTMLELTDPKNPLHKEFVRIFYKYNAKTIKGRNNGAIFRTILKQTSIRYVGLHAVYKLFSYMEETPKELHEKNVLHRSTWIKNFITHSLITTAEQARSRETVLEKVVSRIKWKHVDAAEHWMEAAMNWRNTITMRWHGRAMKMASGNEKMTTMSNEGRLAFSSDWDIYFDSWITYIRTPDLDQTEIYALTSVDIDRIQQLCISRAMVEMYLATISLTSGNDIYYSSCASLSKGIMNLLTDALKNSTAKSSQTICRDMKKAFGIYLSEAAGALSNEGTNELWLEFKKEEYGKSFNYRKYLALLRSHPFDVSQDFGRLFKILPAPDYDLGSSFAARYDEVQTPNEITPDNGENPCNMEEFRKYMRKLAIISLMKYHGNAAIGKFNTPVAPAWWDRYTKDKVLPAGLDWVDEIDLRGTARYVRRHEDSAIMYKDTAACEEDVDEALEEYATNSVKRNMLLRYLFDEQCPTADSARRNLTRVHHAHRAGFKMEAHKTKARIFYIGNQSDRLIQSEMEENVHRIAQHTPGYMIGQPTEMAIRKIMSMVAPALNPGEKTYFLNFDLKRWSPAMPKEPQRISHAIWAEVFDDAAFLNAHKINEQSIVLMNKRGYKAAYVNNEANFEGYNGKEMTFMHCALMGYAVFRYIRESHERVTIQLCAFIDDGLATFRDSKGPGRFLHLVKVIQDTYKRCGFILEISKCYLSDTFAIFLNEIYFRGRHITYGLRAAMRIGTTQPEPHETIMDKLNSRVAGCQGAMKAGMDIVSAYTLYLWSSSHILWKHRISEHMDGRAACLYFYTPKALGGLQQPNMLNMATNFSSDPLADGISTLQSMVRAYPSYREAVLSLIKQSIELKTTTNTLISPRTVKPAKCAIVESRISQSIAKTLMNRQLASRARKLLSIAKGFNLQDFADAVIGESLVLVETLVKDVKDASPYSIVQAFVAKFQSARTMMTLIGRGEMRRITKMNNSDVKISMSGFKQRVHHLI